MTILIATRRLAPLALLVLLAACDRQKGPPPPKAAAATAADPAAPSTVALSGAILEPQPSPATAKRATPAKRPAASAARDRVAKRGADPQALRDFQAEQERRDRELLDQDMSEAQLRAREQGGQRERADAVLDESDGRQDDAWSRADQFPPDDELPIDDSAYDEPPYDDEPEPDYGYDPRYDSYRP